MWTWLFWTTFILGFAAPPLWLLSAWAAYMKFRPKKMSPAQARAWRFSRRPCPRCTNDNVDMVDSTYFTCMDCGARGWYPYRQQYQRDARLGSTGRLRSGIE